MKRSFDYEACKRRGWEFVDKDGDFGPSIYDDYVYTDGDTYSIKYRDCNRVIARYPRGIGDFDAFYYKEEVPNHISGGFYFVDRIDGYYYDRRDWATRNANQMKAYLPTRKEVEKDIREYLDSEEEIKGYEEELKNWSEPVSAFINNGGDDNYFKRLVCEFIPYLDEIKEVRPEVDFTPVTYGNVDDFLKTLNSLNSDDRYDWLVSQTQKNGDTLTCCGMEIKHTGRSTKVIDNSDYWVSFAPNSSREYEVQYHKYIKSIVA